MVTKKKILITAGPTWVPVDAVRVITNIASGQTGILLAERLAKAGAKVTLILGPAGACCINSRVRVIRFRFFDEFRKKILSELRRHKYHAIVHSAAVSDFAPVRLTRGKISSAKPCRLRLVPLPKIIDDIRRLAPEAKIAIFKFHPGINDAGLIKEARRSLKAHGADLAVANRIRPDYRAAILDKDKIYFRASSKKELAVKLARLL